ncbi:hypothetical protein H206_00892 [Candidatus Electrothrix aarhusensis]|uniref:Uncharacterized protein n=1 Tax=Candidatus Electrothrix aarhusensis TaxID=1859131 RepID=A0A444IZV0_9BACT|nr:hypothetical protein H206_00892 [Candidatus Electrothrix aarhusensis]
MLLIQHLFHLHIKVVPTFAPIINPIPFSIVITPAPTKASTISETAELD